MKKTIIISFKVFLTINLILAGWIFLTGMKLQGFTIGSISFTAEEVQMFVETAGDYILWIYIVIIFYIIWRVVLKKKSK